jgi:hypothetical protein
MPRAFADITFTPSVKAAQSRYGSREANMGFELAEDLRNTLTGPEMEFITTRDSFYMASVSETGWPYVQHRGGPAGFLTVLDERTLGFADFRGNRQYISVGNINAESRVSLILMDYPSRRRLKLWGTARVAHETDEPELIAALENPSYRARIERAIVIRVEAIEWNCPQHITPRYTEQEIEHLIAPVLEENRLLKQQSVASKPLTLGEGSIALQIRAVRQLTAQVRLYRLEQVQGRLLPVVTPGSHLKVPFLNAHQQTEYRHYSICSSDPLQQFYEIAVQHQPDGRGGSAAIHQQYQLGTVLHCEPPVNHFILHKDARPAVLIAGGIGITPLLPMLRWFSARQQQVQLHYAAKSMDLMAFATELQQQHAETCSFYPSATGTRMDVGAVLAQAPAGAEFYICGPQALMDAVSSSARQLGIAAERLHTERFSFVASAAATPFKVALARSQQIVEVAADQSILDAVLAAGIAADSDCCVGDCGRCAVKVLAGTADHQDQVLTEREKQAGQMCICVSRAVGDVITLDL